MKKFLYYFQQQLLSDVQDLKTCAIHIQVSSLDVNLQFNLAISLQDLKKDVFKLKNEEFTENEMSNIKQENGSWLMVLTEDRIEELDNK